jgi:RNA-directed DNA polymerase
LLAVLGLKEHELEKLLNDIPSLYGPFVQDEKKKDGTVKQRYICPSLGLLKVVQERIKERILDTYALPDYIQGGTKGNDSITNSKQHIGKHFHFCLDLKNFFPSVKNWRINRVLLSLRFSPEMASILTKLLTLEKTVILRRKPISFFSEVPQGAPTSTAICNLVFYIEVDRKIEELIKNKKITYTRYVDDLNFSSQTDFTDTFNSVIEVISEANFKINRKKTFYKKGRVEITGTDVGQNGIRPTKRLIEKLDEPDRSEASKAGVRNHIKRIKNA